MLFILWATELVCFFFLSVVILFCFIAGVKYSRHKQLKEGRAILADGFRVSIAFRM